MGDRYNLSKYTEQDEERYKTKYSEEKAESLLKDKYVYRYERNLKLESYSVKINRGDIKICAHCGESNLEIKRRYRKGTIQIYLIECPDCSGPVIFPISNSGHPHLLNPLERGKFGECDSCEELKKASEMEHDLGDLKPNAKVDVSTPAIVRKMHIRKIDMHHMKYKEDHGEEYTIPLCRECHGKVTNGKIPSLDHRHIEPGEYLEPTLKEKEDLELER